MRRSLVAILALAACGSPTTPEGFPELTGEYLAELNAEFTSVPGGVRTSGLPCAATIAVSRQSAGVFEGTYARGFPCARRTYPLSGTVQRNGAVTVDVAGGTESFQGFDQCRHVSGDDRWRGEVKGEELTLRIDVGLTCPETGTQRTVARLTGRRVPGG